jgi:hypothetical protein
LLLRCDRSGFSPTGLSISGLSNHKFSDFDASLKADSYPPVAIAEGISTEEHVPLLRYFDRTCSNFCSPADTRARSVPKLIDV